MGHRATDERQIRKGRKERFSDLFPPQATTDKPLAAAIFPTASASTNTQRKSMK
jgi:hypothetical protein